MCDYPGMETAVESVVPEQLVLVVAPHFVAAFVIQGENVVRAAPILKWIHGKTRDEMRDYFKRKGWVASIIPQSRHRLARPRDGELEWSVGQKLVVVGIEGFTPYPLYLGAKWPAEVVEVAADWITAAVDWGGGHVHRRRFDPATGLQEGWMQDRIYQQAFPSQAAFDQALAEEKAYWKDSPAVAWHPE